MFIRMFNAKKEIKNNIKSYFKQKDVKVKRETNSGWDEEFVYYCININNVDIELHPSFPFVIAKMSLNGISYNFKFIDFFIIRKCKSICKNKFKNEEYEFMYGILNAMNREKV